MRTMSVENTILSKLEFSYIDGIAHVVVNGIEMTNVERIVITADASNGTKADIYQSLVTVGEVGDVDVAWATKPPIKFKLRGAKK